jgi:class 3 adenylate cyclase
MNQTPLPASRILIEWEPAQADDWLREIHERLRCEQPFLAFDLAKRAAERYPQDDRIALAGILALLRGRSILAARQTLAERIGPGYEPPERESKELLANIYKLLWELEGQPEDLAAARDLFHELFTATAAPHHGILAAILTLIKGNQRLAQRLAHALLAQSADDAAPTVAERHTYCGSAALIIGDTASAAAAFRQVALARDYRPVVTALQHIQLLEGAGLVFPDSIKEILTPPRIVIFGGHPIDPPDIVEALLPPEKADALATEIRAELQRLQARIGYASASCGADLLFAEALLELGGELHLVLPCAEEDFIAARVAYAGPEWVSRFHLAMEQATTITYSTQERYLGHNELLRHANQMITGLGWLRAQFLFSEPYLLVAWDYRALEQPGSAADFIDHWPDIKTLRIIHLDELPLNGTAASTAPHPPAFATPKEPLREIHAMLFADVVGYSKLGEEYLPQWLDFLQALQQQLAAAAEPPNLVEAWGDSIYVVMPSARTMLQYAFALRGAFIHQDHRTHGLPWQLGIRIGLHAGPVFRGIHPLTGKTIYSGRQVNRAARIEPITMPGEVYASHEFVALLTAEETAERHRLDFNGQTYAPWYQANYLGLVEMPKQHGTQQVYHLLPAAG